MADMALPDLVRPSSVDSDRPLSRTSSHPASSISLMSSVAFSDSDDYFTCADEMGTVQSPLEESLFFNDDLEEPRFPLNADADELPSTVFIYSADLSLVASPNLSPCSLPLPSLIPPLTVDQATQSGKHDFRCPCEWATLVVWDHSLPGAFPPDSSTSILPLWWHNVECHGTFGYPTFM